MPLSGVFKQIADRIGPYLNAENWASTVNKLRPSKTGNDLRVVA